MRALRGSGESLYVACIIPLGERRSRETGSVRERDGNKIGCYLSTGKKKKYTLARALCSSALPRLTPTCFHGMAATTTMHARVISPDRIEKV